MLTLYKYVDPCLSFQAVIITKLFSGTYFGSHSFPSHSLLLSTTILNDKVKVWLKNRKKQISCSCTVDGRWLCNCYPLRFNFNASNNVRTIDIFLPNLTLILSKHFRFWSDKMSKLKSCFEPSVISLN